MTMPHQIVTRAVGGTVGVVGLRDPADGAVRFAVSYTNRGGAQPWLSTHRFSDVEQAAAGAKVLADFLGAGVRE